MAAWSRRCCWRHRAATARVSNARSRRSRRRSACTARRSTSASRSCTTCTSCATSRHAAPSSSRTRTTCPEGETVVFSAHGIAPSVRANAAARQLATIDATCPLVTKVHVQAKRYAAAGYTIVFIGHAGHEEVVGTIGEAPEATVLVESVADVDALSFGPDAKLAYLTQTTLSVDETGDIITALRQALPDDLRAEEGGHLLRDVQPAVGRQGDDRGDRSPARRRVAQLVELEPAGRGGARGRRRRAADRRRDRHRRSVARRRRDRRPDVGRLGARDGSSSGSATGSAPAASPRSSRTGSSTRTSSSGCRPSCAASSRSPTHAPTC